MPKVDVQDLEMALDWVSTDFLMNRAFVNRQTGEISGNRTIGGWTSRSCRTTSRMRRSM